jgi:hypothetical protein
MVEGCLIRRMEESYWGPMANHRVAARQMERRVVRCLVEKAASEREIAAEEIDKPSLKRSKNT